MNNKQIAKKNMYDKVRKFLTDNGAIWVLFIPLVDAVADFFKHDDALEEFMGKQSQTTKGITEDKDNKLKEAITLVVTAARKARAWAHTTGDTALEAVFDVRTDDFLHRADTEALTDLKNLRTALNDNVASLAAYNIDLTTITAISSAIQAFEDVIAAPADAETGKILGTEGIEYLIQKIDEDLELIDDLLVNEYQDTEEEMVVQYKIERRIDTVGVHHTRLGAHITYADGSGNAEGITMRVVEPNKVSVTDIEGNTLSANMKSGTYHVEFTAPNIVTKTIIQKIKRGTTVHLEVQVTKV